MTNHRLDFNPPRRYPGDWRELPDFPEYFVSRWGAVWSNKSNALIHIDRNNTNGYPRVRLFAGGDPFNRYVHQLVAFAFIGPRPTGPDGVAMEVSHIDGTRDNNRWDNLEYLTHQENGWLQPVHKQLRSLKEAASTVV